MKTKTINLYQFDELSDDAKQKAITDNRGINVSYDWWHSIYDDAEAIGLKITEFDLYRNLIDEGYAVRVNRHCTGHEMSNANTLTIAQKIKNNHGFDTPTYKLAEQYIKDYAALDDDIDDEVFFDLEREFIKDLCEEYSIFLQKECEWLMSEEAIVDSLMANEYEFLEDGSRA